MNKVFERETFDGRFWWLKFQVLRGNKTMKIKPKL